MPQPVSVITADERRPPPHRLMSISSGPMSEGMIPSVSTAKQVRRKSNSTEHVCLFSVCLMFIGVPIIVVGILTLTIFTPFAIIMLLIGVVASVSGAVLVVLTGLITCFTRRSSPSTTPADYSDGQTPEIIIEDTLYTESFDNNLCEELPEQPVSGLADLPSMEQLDPVQWSNYPEAQNPKSYLQSFGDLPKVLPSPDIRPTSASKRKPMNKKSKKSGKSSIRRKLSKIRGMSAKRKTISRTSLTHEYSDEIQNSSSFSSTSSSCSSPVEPKNAYLRIKGATIELNNNNQSIVTIENIGQNTDDCNEEEVLSSSADNHYDDCNQTNDETDDKSIDNYSYNEHKNIVINGVLPDDYTDSIELTERIERKENDAKYDKSETWVEAEDYSDHWNSKPCSKK